ncbi:MAG: DUF11 domain-containing protein, partial [Actinobacteria bacterium]|nr:DUF11 domain-containing protein [Actinomycetota bacterium]
MLCAAAAAAGQARQPAGATISNRARLAYTEPGGGEVVTVTPTVIVTVAAVAGVVVTPDESEPSGELDGRAGAPVSFRVCNSGNGPLSYVVASASTGAPASVESVHLDSDSSGTVSAGDAEVALGVTRTPELQPDGCAAVVVVVAANGAAPLSTVVTTLVARGADADAAPPVEDAGRVVRAVRNGPRITSPEDANLPPRKSVDGQAEVVVAQSAVVEYEIALRNAGATAASDVTVSDVLPEGLSYVPGTLRLAVGARTAALSDAPGDDEGEVSGRSVVVRLPALGAGEVAAVRFRALVGARPGGSALVNIADVRS